MFVVVTGNRGSISSNSPLLSSLLSGAFLYFAARTESVYHNPFTIMHYYNLEPCGGVISCQRLQFYDVLITRSSRGLCLSASNFISFSIFSSLLQLCVPCLLLSQLTAVFLIYFLESHPLLNTLLLSSFLPHSEETGRLQEAGVGRRSFQLSGKISEACFSESGIFPQSTGFCYGEVSGHVSQLFFFFLYEATRELSQITAMRTWQGFWKEIPGNCRGSPKTVTCRSFLFSC